MNNELPNLNESEKASVHSFLRGYPLEFNKNMTNFFISEIVRYIMEKRVFRISIMGETRSGKSEIGSTICFWYVKIFNNLYSQGHFKDLDVSSEGVKVKPIEFNLNYVYDNQQVYKTRLKERNAKKELVFGQIHQIDEEKDSVGGMGSWSDIIESNNLNNIIAKFNQSEIYTKPNELQMRNCPYGIKTVKKDEKNRCNWCLLFKIESMVNGVSNFNFMGWVKIPLHHNEDFRKKYNLLKNEWIEKEISGRVDERLMERSRTAMMLLKEYPSYFEFNEKDRMKYSKDEQIKLLERLMMMGKIKTVFNQVERFDIVLEARLMAEEQKGIER